MRCLVLREPGEERRYRLADIRQHHRAATGDGPQEDLQAAVAADIVEGAPDRDRRSSGRRSDCGRQAGKCVAHDLRDAGRAGCQQQPARLDFRCSLERGAGRQRQRQTGGESVAHRGGAFACKNHGVDVGTRAQFTQIVQPDIGRAQQHLRGKPVELDHRSGCRQLVVGEDQNGLSRERAAMLTKRGSVQKVGEIDCCARAPQPAWSVGPRCFDRAAE